MNRIYLLRHTDALPGASDVRRRLSEKGRWQAVSLGQQIACSSIALPLKIFHSSLLRARETGEILIKKLEPKPVLVEKKGLKPEDDPTEISEWLKERKEPTMIIGHNPFLEKLAGLLIENNAFAHTVSFRKGALLCLEKVIVPHPTEGPFQRWAIHWMLVPKLCRTLDANLS